MLCYKIDLGRLLKVTMSGVTVLKSAVNHPKRTLKEYVFYIISEGTLTLNQNGSALTLKAGDGYIFAPGESHFAIASENCTYCYFHLANEGVEPFDISDEEYCERIVMRNKSFSSSSLYETEPYENIYALLPKEFRIKDSGALSGIRQSCRSSAISYANHTPRERLRISAEIASLIMRLEDLYLNEQSENRKLSRTYVVATKILSYVEKNFSEPFGAKELSESLYINYDYANRIFKRFVGQSIINYRNTLRINTAKALLLQGNIDEIYEELGFSDKYYFLRLFKRLVGISAEEYRQMEMKNA